MPAFLHLALAVGLTALAGAPAFAQRPAPPSPYVPLQDKPTCTRAELKTLTAAYVAAQRNGSLAGLPLHEQAHFLENMKDVEKSAGLWNSKLAIDNAMSFHDELRCKSFTEIIVTGPVAYVIGTRLMCMRARSSASIVW